MTDAVELAYARAERVTAEWAKSFYFSSRCLPLAKKRAIFALYDYCRHADNLVDDRGERSVVEVRADLARLDADLRRIHAGDAPLDARWLALRDTLQRFPIPLEPLTDLLVGVATDLEPVEFDDFATLHHYCYLVAGGVGLMLGPVLGAPTQAFRDPGVGLLRRGLRAGSRAAVLRQARRHAARGAATPAAAHPVLRALPASPPCLSGVASQERPWASCP